MRYVQLYKKAISEYRRNGFPSLAKEIYNKFVTELIPSAKLKKYISGSKTLTSLYFHLDGSFYHEQKNILNGVYIYECEESKTDPTHRRIRRTHSLEKGLIIPESERLDRFGGRKAATLVHDLMKTLEKSDDPLDDESILWTIDVLQEYFDRVDADKRISEAKCRFEIILNSIQYTPNGRVPKTRLEKETSEVTYNQLNRLADQRSSTRYFTDKNVPRELIDKALRIASKSPSACNRQSYKFRIYDDRSQFDDLLDHRIGTSTFEDNIPVLIVLTGKQRGYYQSERNTIFIDASLAAMSFQFALETLGLASCMINWKMYPNGQKKIEHQLNLDPDEQVIAFMAVGYPDLEEKIPYSGRKNIKELRSYNQRN